MTKELFLSVYNKYPSSWISEITFKYFSQFVKKKDSIVKKSIIYTLIGLFFVGFIGSILKLGKNFIGVFTISYGILLGVLVLFLFIGVILNNIRIKKISKELNISVKEYNNYIDIYIPVGL